MEMHKFDRKILLLLFGPKREENCHNTNSAELVGCLLSIMSFAVHHELLSIMYFELI